MFKKITLLSSVMGTIVLYVLFNSRSTGLCEIYCGDAIDRYQNVFLFFPIILILSLITYKMSDTVFEKWWSFSKYAIPFVFIISTLINSGIHHDPNGQWQDIFDIQALLILYGIFVICSIVQIVRGYRRK